ncbi:MAG: family 10 glycosylhydrolase [Planctomycetota bacterium]|nr:family 10 glycosylhydrolase [Planctomycetota bacterium]
MLERAARAAIDRAGCFGPFKTFTQAAQTLEEGEARASARRADALAALGGKRYPEAMAAAADADAFLLNAYCASVTPQPGEHRALWCHNAFGVQGMDWDAAIKLLADNGFTAILPNMLWGGSAYYESTVLPVAAEVREKGDQIAQCLAACKKYGLQCHVWKVNWNMGWSAPKDFVEKMKAAGRTQVHFDGKPEGTWLCPSHPDNQKLEVDAMVEVATKYDVDGIHFDYIRYPGPDECFCQGCRERFETAIGAKVMNWPADTRRDDQVRQKWLDFRRANITKVVAAVSELARKAKPKVRISAAVFRNWPVDRDGVGQDWKLWCEQGWLDFVCPMDYTPENAQFENWVKGQLGWVGKVPCYPGIGLSCWTQTNDICKLIDQIQITRRLKTGGFTIFNYDVSSARDIVPLCGKGITKKP